MILAMKRVRRGSVGGEFPHVDLATQVSLGIKLEPFFVDHAASESLARETVAWQRQRFCSPSGCRSRPRFLLQFRKFFPHPLDVSF
jgi:hypothetical protein